MRIAILGATSQIARDFITGVPENSATTLGLFARRPEAVKEWLATSSIRCPTVVGDFEAFRQDTFECDAVINFVGSGNPAQTAQMGASILDITHIFDELALSYISRHPGCRYIFLSSGAAYGGNFTKPAEGHTQAVFPINNLEPQDWYGLAKMYAECKHRTLTHLPIVDIRVFNYFSYSADVNARFLITDTLRSIRDKQIFLTSATNIFRDYAGPREIYQLVLRILDTPAVNCAVDCYTDAPVGKLAMLQEMTNTFGLRYELVPEATGVTATGTKIHYYSKNRRASELFGYKPQASALEVVIRESHLLLEQFSA